jgi:alpha-N-arabinofuranosidase
MVAVTVDLRRAREVGPVRRRTFGSFVEHLGRCVYGGIYEPGHPTADARGFRGDVLELVRELGATTVRYPGGNFVSGYRWEDGIGPRAARPRRLDLAWRSLETNEVGVDEFVAWCQAAGCEPMMAVNLGTRDTAAALELLEYCNHPGGTEWSDRRAANGSAQPYGIRMWCLGNEMDGPWQLGHRSAAEYGALAARTAAAMKQYDRSLELVACGSSGSGMPTFGEWERVVLEQAYDHVDYVSCHAYYEQHGADRASFLASSVDMERFIDAVVATTDHVAARRRSPRRIDISFDEWNVWYMKREPSSPEVNREWPTAPRLLENVYSTVDAVVVGSLLITLLRRSDRVAAACQAQLVNVIAPIMTEPGGPAWRQTTFYPFSITARLAAGTVLAAAVDVSTVDTDRFGAVPMVDAVATVEANRAAVFLVNRSLTEAATVEILLPAGMPTNDVAATTLGGDDLDAVNTVEAPQRVTPAANRDLAVADHAVTVVLPPASWTALELS